jgi:hypothetical protein
MGHKKVIIKKENGSNKDTMHDDSEAGGTERTEGGINPLIDR